MDKVLNLSHAEQVVFEWAERFNTRVPAQVAALYADDATVFGTSKNRLRHGRADIEAYFSGKASVKLLNTAIMPLAADTALCVGTYLFTRGAPGEETSSPARFTFVVKKWGDAWRIWHHHSSGFPEAE
jgi:hypothetical protein